MAKRMLVARASRRVAIQRSVQDASGRADLFESGS
jgi:hypothetical protein